MNYNPSARSELLADSKSVEAHRKMVQDPVVRRGISAALAHASRLYGMSNPPDMGGCATAHLRHAGAQEFVELFYNLCETSVATAKADSTNLPGNVTQIPKR